MVRAATPTPGTAPVTGRCTSYVTLHPIRTGALPTDRVHRLRIGCTTHTHKHNRGERPAPAANAPPLSPHSPIPHVIPWRPDFVAPQKPRDFNVPTSKVETPAGELRAKCGGRARAGTQRQKRHTQHTGTQQTPTATRLWGLSFSSLRRRIETCRQQQTPARRLRSSAALEVVLRGQQDLLPHADRVIVRLAGLGLVVGD